MLELKYTMTAQETAEATLDFLSNRPAMSIMFVLMKYSCMFLCMSFAIAIYTKVVQPKDVAAVIFALLWIIYYRPINRWVIKKALRHRRFNDIHPQIKIDNKGMVCTGQTAEPLNVKWKSLRHILKTKNGYIIPLTGLRNAGRFLWLPLRAFSEHNSEQQFIDFSSQNKIKIKPIK